jgi:hypothetical protein
VRKAAGSGPPCVMTKSDLILGVLVTCVGIYIAAALLLARAGDGGQAPWGTLLAATQRRAQLWHCGKLT